MTFTWHPFARHRPAAMGGELIERVGERRLAQAGWPMPDATRADLLILKFWSEEDNNNGCPTCPLLFETAFRSQNLVSLFPPNSVAGREAISCQGKSGFCDPGGELSTLPLPQEGQLSHLAPEAESRLSGRFSAQHTPAPLKEPSTSRALVFAKGTHTFAIKEAESSNRGASREPSAT